MWYLGIIFVFTYSMHLSGSHDILIKNYFMYASNHGIFIKTMAYFMCI